MHNKTYLTLQEIRDTHAWKRDYERYLPLSRFVFRPAGFLLTWLAVRIGLTSEMVSWLSGLVALIGCFCLIIGQERLLLIGIGLLCFFNLLDCVDGSIARSMNTENPYGKFLDIIMAWVDMGFWALIGIMAFRHPGVLRFSDPLGNGPIFWLAVGGLTCYFSNLITYFEKCFDGCIRDEWDSIKTENESSSKVKSKSEETKSLSPDTFRFKTIMSVVRRINHNLRVRETHYFLLILSYFCQLVDLLLIVFLLYYVMHTIILVIIYSIRGRQLLRSRYKR